VYTTAASIRRICLTDISTVFPNQAMNTGTKKNKTEEELRYLDITDEILDGVFPEEEIRKLKKTKTKSREEFIIDIYGRPQLINNEEVSLETRDGDQTNIIVEKKEDIRHSNKLHQIAELLLPYANIHISILFIIVLSFLSCIFVNIISVIITILFIISLIKLDQKYQFGLAICDSQLIL